MQRLNQELLNNDPLIASEMGVRTEGKDKKKSMAMQTPEELAA